MRSAAPNRIPFDGSPSLTSHPCPPNPTSAPGTGQQAGPCHNTASLYIHYSTKAQTQLQSQPSD